MRRHENVHMIGHEAISVDRAAKAGREGAQVVEICDVVFIIEETVAAIMSALHDMQRELRDNKAYRAWHETANDTAAGRLTLNEKNRVRPSSVRLKLEQIELVIRNGHGRIKWSQCK